MSQAVWFTAVSYFLLVNFHLSYLFTSILDLRGNGQTRVLKPATFNSRYHI